MKHLKLYNNEEEYKNVIKPDGIGNDIPSISLIKNNSKPKYDLTIIGTTDIEDVTFDLYINATGKTDYKSYAKTPIFNNKKFKLVLKNGYENTYRMFDGNGNANIANHLNTIEKLDGIDGCKSLVAAFQYCTNLKEIKKLGDYEANNLTNMQGAFNNCVNLASIGDLSNWDVSKVTNMASLFNKCGKLTSIGDLSKWNVSNVTTMASLFNYCSGLTSVGDLSNWDVSKVTSMNAMFNYCSGLTSIGDLSNWDVSKVTNLYIAFQHCDNIHSFGDLGKWNVSNVTNMDYLFNYCENLSYIGDLSNWNLSKATTTRYMFQNCPKLTSIGDLSNWDVSKVTSMRFMFNNCSGLTSIGDLSNWDVSNVNDLYAMFNNCSGLTSIGDLSNWDVSNITDMAVAFSFNFNLNSVGNLSNWNTKSLTTTSGMFQNCRKLNSIDMTNWDISNLTEMRSMFVDCVSLKTVKLPKALKKIYDYQFNNCNSLSGTIDLSNIVYINLASFENCSSVNNFILGNNLIKIGSFAFNHCSSVTAKTVTIPSATTEIGTSHCFYDYGLSGTNYFDRFIVDKNNTAFTTDEYGVLYTNDWSRFVSMPRNVNLSGSTKYSIHEGVTFLGELTFSIVNTFTELELPDSYEIIPRVNYLTDSKYQDFINDSSSLNSAIYIYTTIKKYSVKSSNTRYSSSNGIIYSKDGTEVIAIPTVYEGVINIPEGVTSWRQGALLVSDKTLKVSLITEINLPSTLTNISELSEYDDETQLFMINKLAKNNNVKITIPSTNAKYKVINNQIVNK